MKDAATEELRGWIFYCEYVLKVDEGGPAN